jgi:D-sedoheptulose 7-phosphate isomerase
MNALAFSTPAQSFGDYSRRLNATLEAFDWSPVERLAYDLLDCWQTGRQVFLVGNGGSAANASHLANDFLCLSKTPGSGLRAHSLAANPSVISTLANDVGYDQVFAMQLGVLARKGDVLIALSGSGNSPNIIEALHQARTIGMTSYAVLGFSGGTSKTIADVSVHFAIDDMQIAEDAQLMVGHMVMQWLYANRGDVAAPGNIASLADKGRRLGRRGGA